MNIEKLVKAAIEIDRLATLQEERSKYLMNIARKVKEAYENGDFEQFKKYQHESRTLSPQVLDYGGAVNDLRKALKAKK